MKTLEQIQSERLQKEKAKLNNLLKSYNRKDISEVTKREVVKRIKNAKKAISNLQDFVKQEIAMNANLLFQGLQSILTNIDFRIMYYENFDEFIEKVSSLEETTNSYEKISNTPYNADIQRAILYFGFTKHELETILKEGVNEPSRDVFISFINKRYKTKIPTQTELEDKRTSNKNSNIVDSTRNKYAYKKMKLRNGDYMKDEYPQYYEFELDTYYKELIKESKNILKRTRK